MNNIANISMQDIIVFKETHIYVYYIFVDKNMFLRM